MGPKVMVTTADPFEDATNSGDGHTGSTETGEPKAMDLSSYQQSMDPDHEEEEHDDDDDEGNISGNGSRSLSYQRRPSRPSTSSSRHSPQQECFSTSTTTCHGPGCSRSRRVTGSYGRSTGIEDLVEISREHGRSAVSMETMDSYGLTCKGGPSTATRRTKLKEQAQP
ncbi:hypothetical protein NDA17_007523 [Ustilago hordei]|nr:hypothetical protein NDA17_007523 [Ustilago hordei]